VARTHGEAIDALELPVAGFTAEQIGSRVGDKTPFDLAFDEARANGASYTEAFLAAQPFQQQRPQNAGEFFNPFLNPAAGLSAGVPGGPPEDFSIGTADAMRELTSPLNFLPVIGDTGLITKPLGAARKGVKAAAGAIPDVADVARAADRISPIGTADAFADDAAARGAGALRGTK
jgi:hypothetical protein